MGLHLQGQVIYWLRAPRAGPNGAAAPRSQMHRTGAAGSTWLRYHVCLFIRPCMTGMPSIITLFGVKLVVMQYTAELHNNCTHNLVLTYSNKITEADVNKWTTRTFRCAAPEYSCTLPHAPLWRMNLGCGGGAQQAQEPSQAAPKGQYPPWYSTDSIGESATLFVKCGR